MNERDIILVQFKKRLEKDIRYLGIKNKFFYLTKKEKPISLEEVEPYLPAQQNHDLEDCIFEVSKQYNEDERNLVKNILHGYPKPESISSVKYSQIRKSIKMKLYEKIKEQ
jgi:hypothetical protein